MILLISDWYNEPDYSFNFSYKVDNFIREKIKSELFIKYKLDIKDENWYLNLVVATDSETKEIDVRGPETRSSAKMIDYGLWLPCDTINNSIYPLESYIDHLFDAFIIVFNNYNVLDSDIQDLKKMCKKEILHNLEYSEVDEY